MDGSNCRRCMMRGDYCPKCEMQRTPQPGQAGGPSFRGFPYGPGFPQPSAWDQRFAGGYAPVFNIYNTMYNISMNDFSTTSQADNRGANFGPQNYQGANFGNVTHNNNVNNYNDGAEEFDANMEHDTSSNYAANSGDNDSDGESDGDY